VTRRPSGVEWEAVMSRVESGAEVVARVSQYGWKSVSLVVLVATGAFADEQAWSDQAPPAKRVMGTIQGVAAVAVGAGSLSLGPGVGGEVGFSVGRWALSTTAELHGLLIVMCGQVGALATRWLSEGVGVGLGVRLVHVQPFAPHFASPNTSVAVPLRLLVALNGVEASGVKGLVLSLSAWGGVQVAGAFSGGVRPTAGFTVGLGHGTW
jgi:hypothetical protein